MRLESFLFLKCQDVAGSATAIAPLHAIRDPLAVPSNLDRPPATGDPAGMDLWTTDGTPRAKVPDCPRCGNDEIGSYFDHASCYYCGWVGTLTELVRKADPEAWV